MQIGQYYFVLNLVVFDDLREDRSSEVMLLLGSEQLKL